MTLIHVPVISLNTYTPALHPFLTAVNEASLHDSWHIVIPTASWQTTPEFPF